MKEMKTLAESLFDSNTQTTESLFDKDLIKKEINFGTQYIPKSARIVDDTRFVDVSYDEEDVKWLETIFKVPALKQNITPYPANEIESYKDKDNRFHLVTEIACYIIPIIMQFPPLVENRSYYKEPLYKDLVQEKIVKPYIKKGHKIDYIKIQEEFGGRIVFRVSVSDRIKIEGITYNNHKFFEIIFVKK